MGAAVGITVGVSVQPGTIPSATNNPLGGSCWLSAMANPMTPATITISTITAEMIIKPPFLERAEVSSLVAGISTRVRAEICEELSRGMAR